MTVTQQVAVWALGAMDLLLLGYVWIQNRTMRIVIKQMMEPEVVAQTVMFMSSADYKTYEESLHALVEEKKNEKA